MHYSVDVESSSEPYVLIVEDQRAMARALSDYVSALSLVRVAPDVSRAREFLESADEIIAAVVDVSLPDGNGLDLLEEVRPRRPLLPVLVLTGREAWDDVNRAFTLSARYIRKTADAGALARMVTSFVIASLPDAEQALTLIDQFCDEYELSPRQREVVRLYIQGCPRDGLAAAMSLSENTVKTHVRETLRKCSATSLDSLCRQILQQAVHTGPEGEEGEAEAMGRASGLESTPDE